MRKRGEQFEFKMKDNPPRGGFKIVLLLLLVAAAVFYFRRDLPSGLDRSADTYSDQTQASDMKVMPAEFYTLSYCGYCNVMRKNLQAANIPFTEFVIDKNSAARKRLDKRSAAMGGVRCCPALIVDNQTFGYKSSSQDIKKALAASQ